MRFVAATCWPGLPPSAIWKLQFVPPPVNLGGFLDASRWLLYPAVGPPFNPLLATIDMLGLINLATNNFCTDLAVRYLGPPPPIPMLGGFTLKAFPRTPIPF